MKNSIQLLALSFVVLLCVTTIVSAQGTTITLLHVNDSHSHLDAIGPKDVNLDGTLGGIAKAATVIGSIRASEDNVLLLHAGDVFQGDLFFNKYFGVPEFQLMLQLGFDAMAVGNHEFDFGPGVLNDALSTAFADGSFPLLSANLDMSAFPALTTWIKPSIIKNVAGVKIGIFGMTVPNNPQYMPAPVIVRDDIVPVAQQAVTNLRDAGAEVVICLSHLGIFYDRIVASSVTGIDFIIGGHDHFVFAQPIPITNPAGKQTKIFQAGEHYKYIGKLRFAVNSGNVSVVDYNILPVDASVTPEPSVQAVISSLKDGIVAQFGEVYHTVLGTAVKELAKVYDVASPVRDTPLGNLITDAYRNKTGTDIALTPDGLISEKIYSGPIVAADVFRAVSYGFDETTSLGLRLAKFEIVGSELLKGLEVGLSQLEIADDFFIQVSGMTFRYSPKRPVGHRVIVGSIRINGKPFLPVAKYTATVNTGVIALLDLVGVHVENIEVLPDLEYPVVRDYIQSLGSVTYGAQGRIQDISVVVHSQNMLSEGAIAVEKTEGVRLLGNYPNPFNPSTKISYELPVGSHVSLKVYNTIGQEVATLVNGEQGSGRHEVVWDASNLPSGVYFYRLQAGDYSVLRKLLLLK